MTKNEYMKEYMLSYRKRLREKILDHYGRICI